jgi:hypothetical protein
MTVTRKASLVSSALIVTFALACGLLGTALLFLSAAPYELVLRIARVATGSQNPLSRAQYSVLFGRILPAGLFYAALAAASLLFRRRLIRETAGALGSVRACLFENQQALLQAWRKETSWHLLCLALIMAVGIVLRFVYLGEPPRNDESFTYVTFAGRSLVHVLSLYSTPNNHILHSVLEWISCRVFGVSLWAMRLPALLAGVALIPLMYATARRFAGRDAGVIAAGLISVSGPFILYSVNARGYTLQAVLLVIMLYVAAELVDGAPRIYWAWFSVAAVAGFWTSPTMLYSYLIAAVWLLWAGGRRLLGPPLIWGAIGALAVIFLYMPVLVVSGPDAVLRNQWVRPLSGEEFRAQALQFPADLYRFLHGADFVAIKILIVAGAIVGPFLRSPARRYRAPLFAVLLLVLLIVPLAQRIVPFPRVLLPIFTVYYLSAAFGLSRLADSAPARHQLWLAVAFVAAVGAMAFHLTRSGYIELYREFPESRAVADYLASQLGRCDRLIFSVSAGAEVAWQLRHIRVPYFDYTNDASVEGRVFVAAQDMPVLPPRGNGLLDPSVLTLAGTLRETGLNTAEYLPSRLVYKNGRGEVFELTSRHSTSNCQAP